MEEVRIEIAATGGPEVMRVVAVDPPAPRQGEVRLRHAAIGVNYLDAMQRSGVVPLPLPSGLGFEAAGEVLDIGPGVTELRPGDRVAYAAAPPGAYSSLRTMAAERVLRLPEGVGSEEAAAVLFKGLTAHYLLDDLARAGPGRTVLVHSAAGGVGQILARWGTARGARMIGVVSSAAKAAAATAAGCSEVIVAGREDIAATARELTGGRGVDVVLDAVGRDTFDASLSSLRPCGLMVTYGAASGPPPPVEVARLGALGSLMLTRPSVFHYTADPAEYRRRAANVFAALVAGHIRAAIGGRWALAHAGEAHRALACRGTTGALLLRP